MQILLIKEDKESRDVIAFFLESKLGAFVQSLASVQEAMDVLLEDISIDLIVADDNEKSVKLFKYLSSTSSKAPVIVLENLGTVAVQAFPELIIASISPQDVTEKLFQAVSEGIKSGRIVRGEQNNPDYCRIKTELLIKACPLRADIFIRLSNVKFVKIFNTGDTFDASDMQKFLHTKKIEYLYLKQADSAEFLNKFTEDLKKTTSVPSTPENAGKMAVMLHELVQELGGALGFTPQVQELAKQGIKLTLRTIGSNPKLSEYLRKLGTDKEKYITSHSMAVAQVSCSIAASMDWASGSTYQRLSFAAFFHDIVFKNQALCQIQSLDELEEKAHLFTVDEQRLYKTHPIQSAAIVKQFTEIPADVDVIILQHHERADATGFPKKIGASYIAPLAAIFIIAHDIVDYLYKGGTEDGIPAFLSEYKVKYGSGVFKKILASIEKNRISLSA